MKFDKKAKQSREKQTNGIEGIQEKAKKMTVNGDKEGERKTKQPK